MISGIKGTKIQAHENPNAAIPQIKMATELEIVTNVLLLGKS